MAKATKQARQGDARGDEEYDLEPFSV